MGSHNDHLLSVAGPPSRATDTPHAAFARHGAIGGQPGTETFWLTANRLTVGPGVLTMARTRGSSHAPARSPFCPMTRGRGDAASIGSSDRRHRPTVDPGPPVANLRARRHLTRRRDPQQRRQQLPRQRPMPAGRCPRTLCPWRRLGKILWNHGGQLSSRSRCLLTFPQSVPHAKSSCR